MVRPCRTRTLATSSSPCWPPGTKPPRPHWRGHSSGSAGTRAAGGAGRGGRQRRQRATPGDDLGGPTGKNRHRFRRPPRLPADYRLGEWVIPRGYSIIIGLARLHANPDLFPDPERFDPQRFVGTKPSALSWFRSVAGPGAVWAPRSPTWRWTWCFERYCATSRLRPRTSADERWHCRGVAFIPKDGGRVVVRGR